MAKALTKAQIVTKLADKSGLTKRQINDILAVQADLAYKEAKNGFTIPGIGKLVVVNRKARMGRNPATGQDLILRERRVVTFKCSGKLRNKINGMGYTE